MLEAANKILKYRYIFPKNIQSYLLVEPVVRDSITDYNARPHYSHHGLSPDETYAGKTFDFVGYKERLIVARERRLTENRKTIHPCTPIIDEIIKEHSRNYKPRRPVHNLIAELSKNTGL